MTKAKSGRPPKAPHDGKAPYFRWSSHPNLLSALKAQARKGRTAAQIATSPGFESISEVQIRNKMEQLKKSGELNTPLTIGSGTSISAL